MKRTIQAVILAGLFCGSQVAGADSFAGNGDPVVLPSLSSYAENYVGAKEGSSMPFPASGDVIVLENEWTRADRYATEISTAKGEAFAGNGDPVVLEPMTTRADQFAQELSRHAGGASDPALSR